MSGDFSLLAMEELRLYVGGIILEPVGAMQATVVLNVWRDPALAGSMEGIPTSINDVNHVINGPTGVGASSTTKPRFVWLVYEGETPIGTAMADLRLDTKYVAPNHVQWRWVELSVHLLHAGQQRHLAPRVGVRVARFLKSRLDVKGVEASVFDSNPNQQFARRAAQCMGLERESYNQGQERWRGDVPALGFRCARHGKLV